MSDLSMSGNEEDESTTKRQPPGTVQDAVNPLDETGDGRGSEASADFDYTATRQDVYACFRLLLGRAPSAEEWAGHSTLAGGDLRSVVRSYLDSAEFSDRGLIGQLATRDVGLTRADGFVIYTSVDDLAVGKLVAAGVYEPGVATLFRDVLHRGMAVVDVGANIGFFTMLAASIVGREGSVLAIEPNLENVRLLEASRRANDFSNTAIAACSVGRELGVLSLTSAFSNGTTSPIGGMMSDLMKSPIVPCIPLKALISHDQRIDFLKIDVEGAEYLALANARELLARWRPMIASEFSPGLLESNSGISGSAYLEFFASLGYEIEVIGDNGRRSKATIAQVIESHSLSNTDHIDLFLKPLPESFISKWRRLLHTRKSSSIG